MADIVRLANAVQRGLPGQHSFERRIDAAAKFRADRPRRYGIGTDATLPKLLGHVAGQHVQPTLERGIGRDACRGDAGGGAGDIHNMAAICHQRQQRLCQEKRPFEVDAEQGVEIIFDDIGDRCELPMACFVDQRIKACGLPNPRLAQWRAELAPVMMTMLMLMPVLLAGVRRI